MTNEQVTRILDAICEDWAGRETTAPKIEIMHGPANSYTVIDATFPAWEVSDDGILRCETSSGTRWITCESIHCIGI